MVDLHGQHEHQSLLHTETHIDFLDEFGNYQQLIQQFKTAHLELIEKENEHKELLDKEKNIKEKKDFYSFHN